MKFSCRECSQHIEIADEWAGYEVNCPNCGVRLTVPEPLPPVIRAQNFQQPPSEPPSQPSVEASVQGNVGGRANRVETAPECASSGSRFSYHRYVRNIDVTKFIQANAIFDEAKGRTFPVNAKCFFCGSGFKSGEAVRLSNGNYICETCFKVVQTIRYPEIYQRRYETFIAEREARRIALEEFSSSLPSTKTINHLTPVASVAAGIAGVLTVGLFILGMAVGKTAKLPGALVGGAVCVCAFAWVIVFVLNQILARSRVAQANRISQWNSANPEPEQPVLKEFHDPTAELTERDRRVLQVFDYWPGYPPYWDYVRGVVLNKDKGRCQISGCPSRTELHVHHMLPISQGGSHRIENLVTLCVFHHGLQPDMGHERIWGEVRTQYFSMVRPHYRDGSFVRAHVRRKELATEESLKSIFAHHSFACPDCGDHPLRLHIDCQKNEISVSCASCSSEWHFDQKLPEESGPQMAETFQVLQNKGRGKVDFSLMETIRKPRYHKASQPITAKQKQARKKRFEQRESIFCPRCGKLLRQVEGRFGRFWGCTGYPDCRYTKNIERRNVGRGNRR